MIDMEVCMKEFFTVFFGILIFASIMGISWFVTCVIIKLITICFGLTFSWSIATGIWLILLLLKSVFNITVQNKR